MESRSSGADVLAGIGVEGDGGALEASDRRRRTTREFAEMVVSRSEWLLPADRALIRAVYEDDRPAAEAARLCGVRPDSIRRRMKTLIARMTTPAYALVATGRGSWPPKMRKVATACFLHGLTMRAAAEELEMSLHDVRRHRDAVQALVDEQAHRAREKRVAGARWKGAAA